MLFGTIIKDLQNLKRYISYAHSMYQREKKLSFYNKDFAVKNVSLKSF